MPNPESSLDCLICAMFGDRVAGVVHVHKELLVSGVCLTECTYQLVLESELTHKIANSCLLLLSKY